ncbi:hypothetical protein FRC17_000324 [Serendipita sp. 399]|nr:hypothetical protein FRC17_000324 [Serendipita sp. 399]
MKHDILTSLVFTLTVISSALGHGIARSMHPREIASRQLAANKRHIKARNCAAEINAYHERRKLEKRSGLVAPLEKRQGTGTGTTSALEPHETTIRNTTCVTAPEVTEGPYYLNNELVRQDIREGSGGILLELDIGIIDTSTCQPLPNALVEIWHANATGQYSGFSTTTTTTGGGGGGGGAMPSGGGGGSPPTESGTAGAGGETGGGGGGGVQSSAMTDGYNFLRGGWPTNDAGIVTFTSVYPGFYTGRTVHIHTMVHTNITYNTNNGTFTSRSGTLVHIGQMFFTDELSNQVMALAPYSQTTMTRTYNADDSILAQENSNGYSGYVDTSLLSSSDVSQGVLGFITVGVDSTAIHDVSSYNYYAGGDVFVGVDEDSTSVYSSRVSTGTGTATGTAATGSSTGSTSGAVGRFAALRTLRAITSLGGIL